MKEGSEMDAFTDDKVRYKYEQLADRATCKSAEELSLKQ